MARKKGIQKRKPAVPVKPQLQEITTSGDWHEVFAIAWAGVGILGILALVSYVPADFPPWSAGAVGGVHNLVGPVGVVAAGVGLYLFGAAAYLWPLLAIGWAVVLLAGRGRLTGLASLAILVWLVSASCILEFQDLFFGSWVERYGLPGSKGGLIGSVVGQSWLEGTLGRPGASVLVFFLYVLSLMVATGCRPVRQLALEAGKVPVPKSIPPDAPVLPETGEATQPQKPRREVPPAGPIRSEELQASAKPREVPSVPEAPGVRPAPEAAAIPAASESAVAKDSWFYPPEAPVPRWASSSREAPSGPRPARESVRSAPRPVTVVDTSGPAAEMVAPGARLRPDCASTALGEANAARYQFPSLGLLAVPEYSTGDRPELEDLRACQSLIIETLRNFRVRVEPGDITRGPSVTRYEFYPERGLSVRRIAALEADIALATRAKRINILAPIPGKDTVGIELANEQRVAVGLRELLQAGAFADAKAQIPLALGKDVYGKVLVADLAAMPHLLIAGATGSGKSVCLNTIIASLLYRFRPDELRLIMIDPKVVEMQVYGRLPHLAVPVVTEPKKVLAALRWCLGEMERRYRLFAETGVRKLDEYNARIPVGQPEPESEEQGELFGEEDFFLPANAPLRGVPDAGGQSRSSPGGEGGAAGSQRLSRIVVIIDELADLMQAAPADVETSICRLCQKARAAGIHVIVATQSPRADVVTGLIKANIPARIAFQVSSGTDSRVILDKSGAERLAGKGDLLFQPPDSPVMVRAQGAFLSDEEVERLVEHCASQAKPQFDSRIRMALEMDSQTEGGGGVSEDDEDIFQKAFELICEEKRASTSFLQRRMRLGYTRAARLMDLLEERGVVGPAEGAKPREILVADPAGED